MYEIQTMLKRLRYRVMLLHSIEVLPVIYTGGDWAFDDKSNNLLCCFLSLRAETLNEIFRSLRSLRMTEAKGSGGSLSMIKRRATAYLARGLRDMSQQRERNYAPRDQK